MQTCLANQFHADFWIELEVNSGVNCLPENTKIFSSIGLESQDSHLSVHVVPIPVDISNLSFLTEIFIFAFRKIFRIA